MNEEIDKELLRLFEKDCRFDTFTPGNTVRVTHMPTGVSTVCGTEVSETANKEQATQDLLLKLSTRDHEAN